MINLNYYEKKIISSNNRFILSYKESKELKKNFKNSIILITGACGSIGQEISKEIIKYKFSKIFFIDKDENQLTELNREITLIASNKKLKKIRYICVDLTSYNISNFLLKNNITHYLNFAAIKHVRSEEEFLSSKYMFLTNSICVIPKQSYNLKLFFSVSTDKAVNPKSFLGISKYYMEKMMANYKKKFKNVFVSTVRFANVSFSNGSILKYALDRIEKKRPFGIPKNICRYFITHEEACSLCFKAILKKNDGKIILPNEKILKKQYLISDIIIKILKLKKLKFKFISKKNHIIYNKFINILLTSSNNHGQKNIEQLFDERKENLIYDIDDNTIVKTNLSPLDNVKLILNKINNLNNFNDLYNFLKKKFFLPYTLKKYKKVSHTI